MLGQAGGEDSECLAPSHSRHKGNCAVLLLSWHRGFYQVYLNPIKPAVQGADLAANQAANPKKKKKNKEKQKGLTWLTPYLHDSGAGKRAASMRGASLSGQPTCRLLEGDF